MPVPDEVHETLQKQYADVMADGGSYRKLQVKLDEALQQHVDLKAAHERALALAAEKHAADLARVRKEHEDHVAAVKAEHQQHVEALKQKHLLPALQDLHNRRVADLAAQAQAEMEALMKG